jgi:hypothetical protein
VSARSVVAVPTCSTQRLRVIGKTDELGALNLERARRVAARIMWPPSPTGLILPNPVLTGAIWWSTFHAPACFITRARRRKPPAPPSGCPHNTLHQIADGLRLPASAATSWQAGWSAALGLIQMAPRRGLAAQLLFTRNMCSRTWATALGYHSGLSGDPPGHRAAKTNITYKILSTRRGRDDLPPTFRCRRSAPSRPSVKRPPWSAPDEIDKYDGHHRSRPAPPSSTAARWSELRGIEAIC